MRCIRTILAVGLKGMACLILLSLVCVENPELPSGEVIGQWFAFDKRVLVAAGCILLAVWVDKKGGEFPDIVSWALIFWGSMEAVRGICQLYGFSDSGHSLYAMTGSFFNPGPYSGYVAMVLPVCLHQYLIGDGKMDRVFAGGAGLLILCVLPAGMSRSAWLAGGVSCLWVYACYADWGIKLKKAWQQYRRLVVVSAFGGVCGGTGWLANVCTET
mgnify:FL=1